MTDLDLDQNEVELHLAAKALHGRPYTAPEVFVETVAKLGAVGDALVAEVRRARGVADAALAELDRSLEARDRRAEAERDAARAEAERLREENAKLERGRDGHNAEMDEVANLLADARAEAARVREALQAIRDLHHRIVLHDWCNHADRDACSAFETVDGDWVCGEPVGDACAECEEDGEHVVTWPCPTARALDAALDGAE